MGLVGGCRYNACLTVVQPTYPYAQVSLYRSGYLQLTFRILTFPAMIWEGTREDATEHRCHNKPHP